MYRVRQNEKKSSLDFCCFLSNRLDYQSEILPTYSVVLCMYSLI